MTSDFTWVTLLVVHCRIQPSQVFAEVGKVLRSGFVTS